MTTFSPYLAGNLAEKLDRLVSDPEIRKRIAVDVLSNVAKNLYQDNIGNISIADNQTIAGIIDQARLKTGIEFDSRFLTSEWNDVVDAWGVMTWEFYRDVPRLGRKTRLGVRQREELWSVFQRVRFCFRELGLATPSMMYAAVSEAPGCLTEFQHIVVDEAQDLGVAELKFVQALAGQKTDGLFFAGDLGQRIFQTPFSWKSIGVDIRGRSFTLKINYRTTEPIRRQADRLLPSSVRDIDGNEEDRRGVVSLFDGISPKISRFSSIEAETAAVADWVRNIASNGVEPQEIGLIVRSNAELQRV